MTFADCASRAIPEEQSDESSDFGNPRGDDRKAAAKTTRHREDK